MNLLQTVPSINIADGGGLGAAALELHLQLRADGFHSQLITTARASDSPPASVTALTPRWPNPFFFHPASARLIDAAVHDADVVHTHGLYTHLNWCVGDSCTRWRKPLVYHPHGTLAPWYQKKRVLQKQLVHWLFENRNFRQVRWWRAVSEAERVDILRACGNAEVAVIPNGIDVAKYPSTPERQDKTGIEGIDPTRRSLLFLGRIAEVKGVELLLKAWERLHRFHDKWQLLIVGPDFENYREQVRRWAAQFPPPSAPRIIDAIAGAEKLKLLNSSNLFVLPSKAEGFPVTVLEALACHVPVVLSYACNFSAEVLGSAGWVCEAETDSLVATLENALSCTDDELLSRGRRARELVETRYTLKHVSDRFVETSSRLL